MGDRSGVIAQNIIKEESRRAILENVLRDVTNIVHAEVKLARVEVKEQLRKAGKGAGLFGAAALFGLLAAGCLTACLIAALALVMAVWLAALIAGVLLAVVGAALYAAGRDRLITVKPPLEETRNKIRSDYQWLRQQTR